MIDFIIRGLWFYLIGGVIFTTYVYTRHVVMRSRDMTKLCKKMEQEAIREGEDVRWIAPLIATPFGLLLFVGLTWPIMLYFELFGARRG